MAVATIFIAALCRICSTVNTQHDSTRNYEPKKGDAFILDDEDAVVFDRKRFDQQRQATELFFEAVKLGETGKMNPGPGDATVSVSEWKKATPDGQGVFKVDGYRYGDTGPTPESISFRPDEWTGPNVEADVYEWRGNGADPKNDRRIPSDFEASQQRRLVGTPTTAETETASAAKSFMGMHLAILLVILSATIVTSYYFMS